MKQIRFNPAHKHLFSEDFITGFNEGAKRQYEADARPKGKWIDITKCGGASLWKCSECGELFLEDFYYCPNCGADMRETE